MKRIHLSVLFLTIMAFTGIKAQYSTLPADSLSLAQQLHTAMHISLEKPTVKLNMNIHQLLADSRGFYIQSYNGTFEQYSITGTEATRLPAWKGHYPPPGFGLFWNEQNMPRDSYNPHGAGSIGEALFNGVLNGLILRNKY